MRTDPKRILRASLATDAVGVGISLLRVLLDAAVDGIRDALRDRAEARERRRKHEAALELDRLRGQMVHPVERWQDKAGDWWEKRDGKPRKTEAPVQWWTGPVVCSACGHRWVSVHEVVAPHPPLTWLECPACGLMTGRAEP